MIKVTYDIPTRSSASLSSENPVNNCHYLPVKQTVGADGNFLCTHWCNVMSYYIPTLDLLAVFS